MEIQCVAFARQIVRHYYFYLHHNRPDLLVALYRPRSRIARIENGVIAESAVTMQEIEALVVTWNYRDLMGTVFYCPSWSFGVLVVSFGTLRRPGFRGRHKFVQTFFIAPSSFDDRFFIRSDVLYFAGYIDEYITTLPPEESITTDNNDDTTSSSDVADNANPSDEPTTTATFPHGRTIDINDDPMSLSNVAERVVTSKELWKELDSLRESDSPDNARILDESFAADLPSNRTTDTNNDPISFSKVAESKITSQGVLMDFDDLLKDSMDIAHLLVESITAALPSDITTYNNNDLISLSNIAECEKTSQQALMELDDLLKSDSLDNAHPSDESIATILPPDRTTDNKNDPISLSSVAESEITSQLEPEFDDLLESDTSDESPTSVEIDSLDSFPNHFANDMRSKACKESLDIEGVVTLDQERSHPKYVSRVVLPDAGDTDLLESLTTLANEMSIQPRTNGF